MSGCSTTACCQVVSRFKGRDAGEPMEDMARALRVELETVRENDPFVVRQMEIACCDCGEKEQCEHELAAGTANRTFENFCPNAGDFLAMGARRPKD